MALQSKRMSALEDRVADLVGEVEAVQHGAAASCSQQLPNVVADEIGDMRDQIRALQAQVMQLQAGAPISAFRAGEVEAPAKLRSSDQLEEDDMIIEHGASRGAVGTTDGEAQTDADGLLASAARRLDESLTEVLKLNLNLRRQGTTVVQVRKLTLAAGDLLSALGYRHASADAADGDNLGDLEGQKDGASADCADGELDAVGRHVGTAAGAPPLRDDREGDRDAAAMSDVADTLHSAQGALERHVTETYESCEASERPAPGAYIGRQLEADQPISDTDLDRIIAEAQAEDARHCAEAY